jgi:hypothetical protein
MEEEPSQATNFEMPPQAAASLHSQGNQTQLWTACNLDISQPTLQLNTPHLPLSLCARPVVSGQALVHDEMCRVYGSDSVEAVVPVYNTNTLDTAAAKYWTLAGEFEGGWCASAASVIGDQGGLPRQCCSVCMCLVLCLHGQCCAHATVWAAAAMAKSLCLKFSEHVLYAEARRVQIS